MKRYLITLLFSLSMTLNFFGAEMPAGAMKMPQLGDKELEALNDWAKVLEGFSQEELEELANIGEMYMKELEQQGIDPMEFLFDENSPIWEKPPEQETQPEEPKKPMPLPEPPPLKVPDEPKETKVLTLADKEKIKAFKHKLEDITEKIGSLRQKAESNRALSEKLQPFDLALSDITYFVLTIKEDHLLRYLFEKKFESLYALLLELHQALETYEPQVYVTEFSLEGEDPYTILDISPSASFETIYQQYQTLMREESPFTVEARLKEQGKTADVIEQQIDNARRRWNKIIWAYEALQAKENSKYAFEILLNIFQEMLHKHNIIAQCKELLRAYDPEALKMKEEQESKEKKARSEQERLARQRPPWTQPTFAAPPSPRNRYSYDDIGTSAWNGASDWDDTFGYTAPTQDANGTPGKTEATPSKREPQKGKKPSKKDKGEKAKSGKDKDKKNGKSDKKPSKKSPTIKKETDRKVFRVEDSLDSLKTTLSENETLINDMKPYFSRSYNAAENETALKVNQLLASITQEFSTLEKRLQEDFKQLKDSAPDKKHYITSISKAHKSFKDNDKVKKALEVLNSFAVQNNTIMYKDEVISANPIKRFLVAGIPVPEAQRNSITPELESINNPLVMRGVTTQENINYIENFQKAYTKLDKVIKETFHKQ